MQNKADNTHTHPAHTQTQLTNESDEQSRHYSSQVYTADAAKRPPNGITDTATHARRHHKYHQNSAPSRIVVFQHRSCTQKPLSLFNPLAHVYIRLPLADKKVSFFLPEQGREERAKLRRQRAGWLCSAVQGSKTRRLNSLLASFGSSVLLLLQQVE
ncbi:hypothetical protein BaRGS_00022750 [Batillaria attramentaria]|uniref:Uncharacterized protein n=1 Tax=Batillaria attramentaria TaxID=370345 RepID=A0ABD0KFR3_9CAEN